MAYFIALVYLTLCIVYAVTITVAVKHRAHANLNAVYSIIIEHATKCHLVLLYLILCVLSMQSPSLFTVNHQAYANLNNDLKSKISHRVCASIVEIFYK
jgi:hypothetical protein